MAGTFQDGFPLDPVQAVQAATFLTEQERNEWMSWLNSASPDDKAELVNTLHEIWMESKSQEQSQAAPAPQQSPAQPPVPPPAPSKSVETQTVEKEQPSQASTIEEPVPTVPPPPSQPQTPPSTPESTQQSTAQPPVPPPAQALPPKPIPQPKVEEPRYSFKQVEEKPLPPRQSQNQPRRDDRRPERREERGQFRTSRDERDIRRNDTPRPERRDERVSEQRDNRDQRPNRSVSHSSFTDLSKLQTDKTRSVLDNFLKEFSQNRRNEEQAINRLREAVLGVEEITNYADLLAEKILGLNNAQVQATKNASKTKDELLARIDDVEIKIDDIRSMVERNEDEIERLGRRQRAFEANVKEMMTRINEQLSGMSTDQFTGGDKIEILNRRLDRLESIKNARQSSSAVERPSKQQIEVPHMPAHDDSSPSAPTSRNFMPLKLGNKGKIEE